MKQIIPCIVLLVGLSMVQAECPSMKDVPVWYTEDSKFLCAVQYLGWGDQDAIRACNSCTTSDGEEYPDGFKIADGADEQGSEDHYFPMGSVIVRPGCTLYLYSRDDFEGSLTIRESDIYPDHGGLSTGDTCAAGYDSYQCRCSMDPVTCSPTDEYQIVIQCDNTESIETTECNYIKTIGTSYSEGMSESMSIDVSLEYALSASFFGLFGTSLGVSVSTGYDWTHTSEATMSEEVTIEVNSIVNPGYILQIKQASGFCGHSSAKTELFKIVHVEGKTGKVVKEEYEWTFKNGTTLKAENPSSLLKQLSDYN